MSKLEEMTISKISKLEEIDISSNFDILALQYLSSYAIPQHT